MITKIKGKTIFYRHFFYGSALTIGGVIGFIMNPVLHWLQVAVVTAGVLLMFISGLITYTVNKFPEEFRDIT
tara:strand:+ start:865 stop:1080 length:216 start_codon:yes stop_codon:yes gene_type:complete